MKKFFWIFPVTALAVSTTTLVLSKVVKKKKVNIENLWI